MKEELGEDFNYKEFLNIADSSICKVDDYVMQATDFGVNCPNCGERLYMKMKLILIIRVGIVTIHQIFQLYKLMENKL